MKSPVSTLILYFALLSAGCGSPARRMPVPSDAPMKMLWAWERPEDLRFLDSRASGVAYLAQTLTLERETVRYAPRRQPLVLPEDNYLIAVTRIETQKLAELRPSYSEEQIAEMARLVSDTLNRPNVRGVQIDFDAVASERGFYKRFLERLRSELPPDFPLTMTALASWCLGDLWLNELPVDEAIPMVFEMGSDTERVRAYLAKGNDWREPLCTASYGVSVDEPPVEGLAPNRRMYYFKNTAWSGTGIRGLR